MFDKLMWAACLLAVFSLMSATFLVSLPKWCAEPSVGINWVLSGTLCEAAK